MSNRNPSQFLRTLIKCKTYIEEKSPQRAEIILEWSQGRGCGGGIVLLHVKTYDRRIATTSEPLAQRQTKESPTRRAQRHIHTGLSQQSTKSRSCKENEYILLHENLSFL